MKKTLNCSVGIIIGLLIIVSTSWSAYAEVVERKVELSYNVNPDATLEIENKFGKIHITTSDKNQISVKVHITAESKNAERAKKALEKVTIEEEGSKHRPAAQVSQVSTIVAV